MQASKQSIEEKVSTCRIHQCLHQQSQFIIIIIKKTNEKKEKRKKEKKEVAAADTQRVPPCPHPNTRHNQGREASSSSSKMFD